MQFEQDISNLISERRRPIYSIAKLGSIVARLKPFESSSGVASIDNQQSTFTASRSGKENRASAPIFANKVANRLMLEAATATLSSLCISNAGSPLIDKRVFISKPIGRSSVPIAARLSNRKGLVSFGFNKSTGACSVSMFSTLGS